MTNFLVRHLFNKLRLHHPRTLWVGELDEFDIPDHHGLRQPLKEHLARIRTRDRADRNAVHVDRQHRVFRRAEANPQEEALLLYAILDERMRNDVATDLLDAAAAANRMRILVLNL